jgi:predicted nucleotide-binding protein
MALLEPSAPRSATVQAVEDTVALEVPEEQVDSLARDHPDIWYAMARVLAARLRERDNFVAARAERPRLFIGSSSEGKDIVYAVQSVLGHDMLVEPWTDNIFAPSTQTLEALERRLRDIDFAVLVLTPDDVVKSRGKQQWAPRDNVVLEAGLFCGALGRGRTFLLVAGDVANLKLPSDLYGLTYLTLSPGTASDLQARVGPACTQIRTAVRAAGPR